MRKFKIILILFVSLLLSQCDKDNNSIDEYVTAIVDGKEYNAEWRMTRKFTEDGRDWLRVLSANSNPELASTNPDFLEISFSLIDDCLKPGSFDYEFIQDESGMGNFIPFSYNYILSDGRNFGLTAINGHVTVHQIDYVGNGIVKGEFEFEVTDYNDTVQIEYGKFQLKIHE